MTPFEPSWRGGLGAIIAAIWIILLWREYLAKGRVSGGALVFFILLLAVIDGCETRLNSERIHHIRQRLDALEGSR